MLHQGSSLVGMKIDDIVTLTYELGEGAQKLVERVDITLKNEESNSILLAVANP